MKFTVPERVGLLGVLPREGNIISLRIMRKLREDLSFSEAEQKLIKFVYPAGQISWQNEDAAKVAAKEIEVGGKAREIVVDTLTALNTKNQLNEGLITLYETFVERKGLKAVKAG